MFFKLINHSYTINKILRKHFFITLHFLFKNTFFVTFKNIDFLLY